MEYQINGTIMQTVTCTLREGETMYTESGGMAWMIGDIEMDTGMKGGLMAGIKRSLAGESLFITDYTCRSGTAQITFAAEFPGKILPLQLGEGESMIVQKDGFMCAEKSVKLEMHFRKKLWTGLFGGEGFILQRLTGPGIAFVELAGEITEVNLGPGEVVRVDTGHVAMFDPSVQFDVERVKGVKNILFGGEGLFLAVLKGPGRVWLQSMPIANLAQKLATYMPTSG